MYFKLQVVSFISEFKLMFIYRKNLRKLINLDLLLTAIIMVFI